MELSLSHTAAVTSEKGMVSGYKLLLGGKESPVGHHGNVTSAGSLSLGFKFTDRG